MAMPNLSEFQPTVNEKQSFIHPCLTIIKEKLYLNDRVRKKLKRPDGVNESEQAFAVTVHHVGECVLEIWLNLEFVDFVRPQKLQKKERDGR